MCRGGRLRTMQREAVRVEVAEGAGGSGSGVKVYSCTVHEKSSAKQLAETFSLDMGDGTDIFHRSGKSAALPSAGEI